MPFGLYNTPATFQRLIDCVLAGLQWLSCLVYIDDIIVIGRSFEEHLHHLQQILHHLKSAGLKIHPNKYHFLQQEVNFLGHIVSAGGVSPDPSKTSRINEWPTPKLVLEVQQFQFWLTITGALSRTLPQLQSLYIKPRKRIMVLSGPSSVPRRSIS